MFADRAKASSEFSIGHLTKAKLTGAKLEKANLSGADKPLEWNSFTATMSAARAADRLWIAVTGSRRAR